MEIVSEPDIRNAKEAVAYAKAIQTVLRYVGSSDADMEKGMMRFDASVSIRKVGETILNPRAEIKNLNSFRSLESAIGYEIERQTKLYEEGVGLKGNITVGWNDERGETYFLRDKEGADDYRYFPEPDLPPLVVTSDFIDQLIKELPEMPEKKLARYVSEWKLNESEAKLLSSDPDLAKYYEEVVKIGTDPKKASSFVATTLLSVLRKEALTISESKVSATMLGKLVKLIVDGKVSMNNAKLEVFEEMYATGKDPVDIVKSKGLEVVSDTGALEEMCKKVIESNPQSIADYKAGKKQAFFFMIGQVMKQTKGQANAQSVTEIMEKLLQN